MATIDTIITEARYDLRDTNSTLYTDTELYYYANRGLFQLDNVLSAMSSDYVLNEDDVTLTTGDDYASSPDNCMVIRSIWIGSDLLCKVAPQTLYRERKFISSTGQPFYFAEVGTQILVDREADDDYTLKVYSDQRTAALSSGDSMPYNDEFNGMIREMIITLAHKRNEVNVYPDTQIYNFFMERLGGNVIRRNHVPRRSKLDF